MLSVTVDAGQSVHLVGPSVANSPVCRTPPRFTPIIRFAFAPAAAAAARRHAATDAGWNASRRAGDRHRRWCYRPGRPAWRRRRRSGPCLPLPGTEPETTMMNGEPLRSSSINLSRMNLTDDSIFHRQQRRPARRQRWTGSPR